MNKLVTQLVTTLSDWQSHEHYYLLVREKYFVRIGNTRVVVSGEWSGLEKLEVSWRSHSESTTQ